LLISGKISKEDSGKKDDLVTKIKAITGDVECQTKIECKLGVGSNLGLIENADKICIDGEFVDG